MVPGGALVLSIVSGFRWRWWWTVTALVTMANAISLIHAWSAVFARPRLW